MNTGLTYFGRKHVHESLTSSFKNLFSRNLFGITNEYMIPKLKVGTLQLQDNCMLHIKQLIKPAAPIT